MKDFKAGSMVEYGGYVYEVADYPEVRNGMTPIIISETSIEMAPTFQLKQALNGYYGYSGFNEPDLLAETFSELVDTIAIESNYLGDVTEEFKEYVADIIEELDGVKSVNDITGEHKEDLCGLLFDYGIYMYPTYEELAEFNLSKMLDKDDYINGLFESEAV